MPEGRGKQMAGSNPFFAVLGDMKELGSFSQKLHKEVGTSKVCSQLTGLFTFGEDSEFIKQAFQETSNREAYHFSGEEQQKLVTKIIETVPEGSYLLLKGSRSMKLETLVPLLQTGNS